jgi:hypothetical protein
MTLYELKRYMPIQPPNCEPKLPENIIEYMSSSKFSNLSAVEQKVIKNKYKDIYRNYYQIEHIVEHINKVTK